MKILKGLFRVTLYALLLVVLYVGGSILHGTLTDYQPQEKIVLFHEGKAKDSLDKDSLVFFNWNIGYGGLGAASDFFYDNGGFLFSSGKMIRPTAELCKQYVRGIDSVIMHYPADFYLLQEVDSASKRSYFTNEYKGIAEKLPSYTACFAVNFNAPRVPLPVFEPWQVMGKMYSGLATYAAYKPIETTRYQYPGDFPWPTRIFNLDRCMAVNRYPVKGGKELVVINSHNSAYDDGGLKQQEMDYLKKYLLEEYAKGNYVVVGADWNQRPPAFDQAAYKFPFNPENTTVVAKDFMPAAWTWAFSQAAPTNRSLVNKYEAGATFTDVIDYYLLSPNVELLEVKVIDLDFLFSDHQPIWLNVKLKK